VAELKRNKDSRGDLHLTEYRPWGSFTILEEGSFYKIKRLTVLCGKKLSYQCTTTAASIGLSLVEPQE
jgi:mannose-1-phosphate guanylyltransferase/mannose-6-phosphate isomerase